MPEKDDISSIYLLKNNNHVHIKSDLGASQYHTRILCVASLIHRFHLQAVQQQAKQCLSSCFRFYERHSFIMMTVRSEVTMKLKVISRLFFFPTTDAGSRRTCRLVAVVVATTVLVIGLSLCLVLYGEFSYEIMHFISLLKLCVWYYMVSFDMKLCIL